jgi:hypothetical protein
MQRRIHCGVDLLFALVIRPHGIFSTAPFAASQLWLCELANN